MMNQQDIFKKIGSILTELNEQYQFLAQNPDKLNELEMELFLANANFLSDHANIVKKLNTIQQNNQPAEAGNHILLEEQNTIILPDVSQGYKEDDECFEPAELSEVTIAEEEEERVDIKPAQEIIDEEVVHQDTTEKILEQNFFKPDQDDHNFEFVLDNHSTDDKFDYEQKSVDEIFDRPLSKEEEEILAQKKKIHQKEDELVKHEPVAADEDEIGPEPFLMPHEEQVNYQPEVETLFSTENAKPLEALKDTILDEPIISPPVEERPLFTPNAVPVKPVEEPVVSKPAPTINDLLAKSNGHEEQVKAPVLDLKQAINLNEKLLFIKDLFNGYNLAYSEAIDIVNKMNSFEAADSFLQNNYAAKNNWATKQGTVDQFYEILNRRFSK
jgi:hypothetical protein